MATYRGILEVNLEVEAESEERAERILTVRLNRMLEDGQVGFIVWKEEPETEKINKKIEKAAII